MTKKVQGASVVPLATLHPMPDLKLAIVGVVDGREAEMATRLGVSGDKMSRMAALVREAELKHGKCLFCGEPLPASFKQAAKLGWAHLAPVLCPCLGSVRTGYREYIPNWQQQVAMIAARVEARELDATAPVYSNTCRDHGTNPQCQGVFTVYAGDVARNVRKWGQHERWTRCAACRAVHSNNAQSKNIQRPKKQQRHDAPLKASVGELVEAQAQTRKVGEA